MKSKLLLLLAISLFTLAAAAQKKEFVGYRHKGVVYGQTLPNGVRDLGGGLLSDEDYGVTRYVKGNKHYLWLEKITDRDTKGVPQWEVLDVLELDSLKKNQELMFSYSSTCRVNGRENLDTIVLAETPPKGRNLKVVKAWRANTKSERFEKLSTKGLQCRAEKS